MEVHELIAKSFSPAEADAYRSFTPADIDLIVLQETGREVLHRLRPQPGACVLMSVTYAIWLGKRIAAPAYVVVGSLFVKDKRIFGEDGEINGAERFSRSDFSWDGHAWVVLGSYIAEISLFRTAYSPQSPRLLARHILNRFGKGRGLCIWKDAAAAEKDGLRYIPQYVLTEEQMAALYRGAEKVFTAPSSQ
jgi:hypothetical protein